MKIFSYENTNLIAAWHLVCWDLLLLCLLTLLTIKVITDIISRIDTTIPTMIDPIVKGVNSVIPFTSSFSRIIMTFAFSALFLNLGSDDSWFKLFLILNLFENLLKNVFVRSFLSVVETVVVVVLEVVVVVFLNQEKVDESANSHSYWATSGLVKQFFNNTKMK